MPTPIAFNVKKVEQGHLNDLETTRQFLREAWETGDLNMELHHALAIVATLWTFASCRPAR